MAIPGRSILRDGWRALVGVLLLAIAGCGGSEVVRPISPSGLKPRQPPSPMAQQPSYTPPEPSYTPPSTPQYTPPTQSAPKLGLKGAKIVVDAGHGGKDPGTRSAGGTFEKNVVLPLAMALGKELSARGATVVYTRKTDVFLELDQRSAIAEKNRADLFVSVHADAHPTSKSISGATIYMAPNASSVSRGVALGIERALESSGISVRGVRTAKFRVLVGHSRPAVLVESGYLTNATDARNLSNAEYRQRLAESIADGIANGLKR